MSQKLEEFQPVVQISGLNTNKNAVFGGTLSVAGAITASGGITGITSSVTPSGGATVALTAAQSGGTFLFDSAAGVVYTLPTAAAGLDFMFYVSVTATSNSHKVITKTIASEFVAGFISSGVDNTANKQWVGNGTTHVAVTQAAASTNASGGIIGSWVRFKCVTTALWIASGLVVAGGTPVTPFTTS